MIFKGDTMKKILNIIICLGIIGLLIYYIDPITDTLANLLAGEKKVFINKENEYAKKYDFKYVKLTEDFVPYNYEDLLNIYFTVLNNGTKTFTFYCPEEYSNCLDDVTQISKDDTTLTNITNFVHPFNNFNNIKVKRDSSGEITINITHLYTEEEKKIINNEIDNIMGNIIRADMNTQEKIKTFHDYIINNTKYDSNYENGNGNENSPKANGLLFNHLAICGGYADTMAIFLSKIDVKNYKVASKYHVWNALYLSDEQKWVHLDLTWDDPVTMNSDVDTLLHKFFLIDSNALKEFDTGKHEFDSTIYQEL